MSNNGKKVAWLIPCNTDYYDPFLAFTSLGTIDWRQSSRINPGDEVYVYCGKPYKAIMFKTVALKTFIPVEEADQQDKPFYKVNSEYLEQVPRYGYMRLKLVSTQNNEHLSLESLIQHGMNSAPQGPRRLEGKLLDYIESCFH